MCNGMAFDGSDTRVSFSHSFLDTLDENALDAAVDFGEADIDSVIDEKFFAAFPIIKTVLGACKTVSNLRERNFAKQVLNFLAGMRDKTIDYQTLEKHRVQLESDPKRAEK